MNVIGKCGFERDYVCVQISSIILPLVLGK